jgi:hypothetical protein
MKRVVEIQSRTGKTNFHSSNNRIKLLSKLGLARIDY